MEKQKMEMEWKWKWNTEMETPLNISMKRRYVLYWQVMLIVERMC